MKHIHKGHFNRFRPGKIAIAVTLLVLVLLSGCGYDRYTIDKLRQEKAISVSSVYDAKASLDSAVADSTDEMSYDSDDVSDSSTIDNLIAIYDNATDISDKATQDINNSYEEYNSAELLTSSEDDYDLISNINETEDSLKAATQSVDESKHKKDVDNAVSSLKETIQTASDELSASEGDVTDESTRDVLSQEISSANDLITSNSDDIESYNSIITELNTAKDSVASSKAENDAIQAAAAAKKSKAEEASKSSYKSTSTSNSSASYSSESEDSSSSQSSYNDWYISYTRAYGYTPPLSDGGIYEYQSGYFIAHRSAGSNGRRIASLGSGDTVVIDGVRYIYNGEITVAINSYYDDIAGWMHDGSSIGLQTCTGDGVTAVIKRMSPM